MIPTIYSPDQAWPQKCVMPLQTHSTNILEITNKPVPLDNCDGLWTDLPHINLGIKTADCAPIAFIEGTRKGILHAGWRGLCDGIIESMLPHFKKPTIFVGPLFPIFEIQKDDCYRRIQQKFGNEFFQEEGSHYFFQFKDAIASIIPHAIFDPRSTQKDPQLASWRRDHNDKRNLMVI